MLQRPNCLVHRCVRFLTLVLFLGVLASGAVGQSTSHPNASPSPDVPLNEREKNDDSYGSAENEMREKLVLKEEKKRYEENVSRAHEVSQLATQLSQTYETRKSFDSEDGKKLERLEKLTKRIRNEAGGSEADADDDKKDIPAAMSEVVKRVAEGADALEKLVEKTPRQVVSAAVIDQANKLLGLLQRVRGNR